MIRNGLSRWSCIKLVCWTTMLLVLCTANLWAEGTTHQRWAFSSYDFSVLESVSNPYGAPALGVDGGVYVENGFYGRQGVLVSGWGPAVLSIPVQSSPDFTGCVEVSFKLRYFDLPNREGVLENCYGRPAIFAKDSSVAEAHDIRMESIGTLISESDVELESGQASNGQTYKWREWNSVWQVNATAPVLNCAIIVPGEMPDMFAVDDVEVSTRVVPEPSSLLALIGGLASIGGFALRRRRA